MRYQFGTPYGKPPNRFELLLSDYKSLLLPLEDRGNFMEEDGVAPPEAMPSDLQSDPLLSTVYSSTHRHGLEYLGC